MRDEGHRYDTVRLDGMPKHALPQEKRGGGVPGRKERRFPRWGYRVILILALCVLAVLGWYNRANLTPQNIAQWVQSRVVGFGVGDGYPKSIAGSAVAPGNFVSSEKNIVVASDTALSVYNSTAKEILSRPHSYGRPVLKVSGPRALLFNLGGKNFSIVTAGGQPEDFSAEQNILGGALNRNGQCALITAADGYCGMLVSYSAQGSVQCRYWFYDYYPCAVALSPDGGRAAVAGVSAKEGELVSALYLIDLNSGETVQPAATFPGNLLLDVFWEDPSAVTAVGDKAAVTLDPSSRRTNEFSYEGEKLTACDSDTGRTALALSAYEGAARSRLVVLGKTGSAVFSRQISGSVRSVSLCGQEAAALTGGRAFFFPLSALPGADRSVDAGSDAQAVSLRDESSAYILGVSEIRLIGRR